MKCKKNLHSFKLICRFIKGLKQSYSPVLMAHCKRITYIKVYIHTHDYMYRLSIIYVLCGKYNFLCYEVCACARLFVCVHVCVCMRA